MDIKVVSLDVTIDGKSYLDGIDIKNSEFYKLLALIVNIKPQIGIEKINGTYFQLGQVRTFNCAIEGFADLMTYRYGPASALCVQVFHAHNI